MISHGALILFLLDSRMKSELTTMFIVKLTFPCNECMKCLHDLGNVIKRTWLLQFFTMFHQ